MAEKYRIWNPRGALIILHKCSTLVAFWGSRFRLKLFRFFSAISGDFWHNTSSKTPDSESSHLANHFAPNISCRGILGLEIEAKIVSSRFLQISVISVWEKSQKHRIRIPCVVLIILHRLSALGAFWGSRFGPKSFQVVFRNNL